MKRLLLLLLLSPAMLFAQTRRKDVIDTNSDFAIANLMSLTALMSNSKCAKAADIHIVDNGEYSTIFVFRHVITAADSSLPSTPAATPDAGEIRTTLPPPPVARAEVITSIPLLAAIHLHTAAIAAGMVEAVMTPPSPAIKKEEEPTHALPLLAAFQLATAGRPAGKAETVTLPGLPAATAEVIAALPVLTNVGLKTEPNGVGKAETVGLSSLPTVLSDSIEAANFLAAVLIKTAHTRALKAEPVADIPALPYVQTLEVNAIGLFAAVNLKTIHTPVSKPEPVTDLPALPYVQSEIVDAIPMHAAVDFKAEINSAINAEIVTALPALPRTEEIRMPVAEMHLSPEGYTLLQKMEGYSPDLYSLNDGGYTIGFGFFVPFTEGNKWSKGITWEQAEQLMRQKMPVYEDQVKEYINVPLTQNEFDALTMLAYNIGGFSKATTLINDINSEAGFEKLQSDWNRFIHSKAPNVTKGLMKRRKDELEVSGLSDYQPERKIQILKKRN